jgi:UDP-N-acetylglucosamine 1-carboxyvinyltransferase
MDRLIVEGGVALRGTVSASGAKNAALPLMAASLLLPGEMTLTNVPDLRDVATMKRLLLHLGVRCEGEDGTVRLDAASASGVEAPYDLVKTMRASVLVLGPLVARHGHARVSQPGGCAIGARPINRHLDGLRALGATVALEHGYVVVRARKLRGAEVVFEAPTVTGTENLLMAASLAEGVTTLVNAAREPEVVDLASALVAMGAKISGAGTDVIAIEGVSSLSPVGYRVLPDRIEAGTLLVAGALPGNDLIVRDCVPAHMGALLEKLKKAGVRVTTGPDWARAQGPGALKAVDAETAPFPGFPTDMQAQFMALMTLAHGTSVINEAIFEGRYMHVPELARMGADIAVSERQAVVRGVAGLTGAPVMATDLRASASLVIAAAAAEGASEIARVYHLDRGYQRLDEKLTAVGARIRRIHG